MTITFTFEEVFEDPEAFLITLGKHEVARIRTKAGDIIISGRAISNALREEDHIVIELGYGHELWIFEDGVVRKYTDRW